MYVTFWREQALSACLYILPLLVFFRVKDMPFYKRSKPCLYEIGKTTQRKLLLFLHQLHKSSWCLKPSQKGLLSHACSCSNMKWNAFSGYQRISCHFTIFACLKFEGKFKVSLLSRYKQPASSTKTFAIKIF